MNHPTFDADGYPTDETIEAIEKWPINDLPDVEALLLFVHEAWRYPDYFTVAKRRTREKYKGAPLVRRYDVSTGGWSGNESLIDAMQENFVFWTMAWVQTRRGGHYIFETRER